LNSREDVDEVEAGICQNQLNLIFLECPKDDEENKKSIQLFMGSKSKNAFAKPNLVTIVSGTANQKTKRHKAAIPSDISPFLRMPEKLKSHH